jgi:diguanylate cyclase (GGDEF)-like protein
MERIRNIIKETPIVYDNKTIYAKVSVGVPAYPDTTKDLSVLIDRADKAMYYSKNNGRDRLTVDNENL